MKEYKFKNYSNQEVVLKYKSGESIRIGPGENVTTTNKKVARRLREIPEFSSKFKNKRKPDYTPIPTRKRKPLQVSDHIFNKNTQTQIKNYFKQKVFPSVSIIILTKDCPELIVPCINSIIDKVMWPHCKLIIGDTGSTDKDTLKFYEELQKSYSNIKVRMGLEYHFGKNYNTLIQEADTNYVLMLNNDTVALNDFVTKMMKYIQNNKIAAVGAQLLHPDGTIQHIGQCIYDRNGLITSSPGHYHLNEDPKKINIKSRYYVDGVTAACMLVNRDLFLKIGGFDERYVDIFQDVDLNLKFRAKGYRIFQCNEAKLIHHDNYSRKKIKGGISGKEVWKDTALYAKKWIDKGNPPVGEIGRKNPKISFLTPVANKKDYIRFVKSVDPSKERIEYVFVRNRPEEAGMNSPQVLNVMNEIAEGDYVVMCHEDITLSPQWVDLLLDYIEKVEKKDPKWGLIGIVGIGHAHDIRRGISFLEDDPNNWAIHMKQNIAECSGTIDEVCIVAKRGQCKFDESLDGFHFYGADACLNMKKNKKSMWIVNAPLKHHSEDGSKNLKKDEEWAEYKRLSHKLIKKWKGIDFATTTMVVKDGHVMYWLADKLKKQKFERVY